MNKNNRNSKAKKSDSWRREEKHKTLKSYGKCISNVKKYNRGEK